MNRNFQIRNKKGLSNIIATVLIVLLALAAVAILWSFVRTSIEGSGSQIELRTLCTTTIAKPTTCVNGTDTKTTATVNVQLSSGDPKDIDSIIVALDTLEGERLTNNSIGNSPGIITLGIPKPLETTKATFNLITTGGPYSGDSAIVAVVVTDGAGNTLVCDESLPVNCVQP